MQSIDARQISAMRGPRQGLWNIVVSNGDYLDSIKIRIHGARSLKHFTPEKEGDELVILTKPNKGAV